MWLNYFRTENKKKILKKTILVGVKIILCVLLCYNMRLSNIKRDYWENCVNLCLKIINDLIRSSVQNDKKS